LRFPVGVDVRDGGEGGAKIDSDCFAIAHVRLVLRPTQDCEPLNAVSVPPAFRIFARETFLAQEATPEPD
jgi:hypothetical protein